MVVWYHTGKVSTRSSSRDGFTYLCPSESAFCTGLAGLSTVNHDGYLGPVTMESIRYRVVIYELGRNLPRRS